jgi:hypothetical protein
MTRWITLATLMFACSAPLEYPLPCHEVGGVRVEYRLSRGPLAETGWDNGTPVVWVDPFLWDTTPDPVRVAVIEHELCHLDNGADELEADCCAGERSRLTTGGAAVVVGWYANLTPDPNHPEPAVRAARFLECWVAGHTVTGNDRFWYTRPRATHLTHQPRFSTQVVLPLSGGPVIHRESVLLTNGFYSDLTRPTQQTLSNATRAQALLLYARACARTPKQKVVSHASDASDALEE